MPENEPQVPDLGGLLDSFQRVQAAREALYEGTAGGGAVVVRASGDLQFEAITISPEVVDPADVEMLQDLVLAALHDLAAVMAAAQQDAMGALGGIDLGGLIPGATGPGDEPPGGLPPGALPSGERSSGGSGES